MAGTLTTKILARVIGTRKVAFGLGTQSFPATLEESLDWPDGSGASQADEMWTKEDGSVAAGAHDNWDLKALPHEDTDDDTERTIDLANIKLLFLRNTSSSDYLVVGGGTDGAGAADAWVDAVGTEGWLADDSDLIHVPAGGCLLMAFPSGVTVTNATADILHIGGITSTQTYELMLIGDAA